MSDMISVCLFTLIWLHPHQFVCVRYDQYPAPHKVIYYIIPFIKKLPTQPTIAYTHAFLLNSSNYINDTTNNESHKNTFFELNFSAKLKPKIKNSFMYVHYLYEIYILMYEIISHLAIPFPCSGNPAFRQPDAPSYSGFRFRRTSALSLFHISVGDERLKEVLLH